MLKPLRVGVPSQVQQPQIRGPLLEVLRCNLHHAVSHLRRMVRVGPRQTGQEVGPIALQAGRKDNLIMRRLALEQRRHVRNTHRSQAIEQASACQQFPTGAAGCFRFRAMARGLPLSELAGINQIGIRTRRRLAAPCAPP